MLFRFLSEGRNTISDMHGLLCSTDSLDSVNTAVKEQIGRQVDTVRR